MILRTAVGLDEAGALVPSWRALFCRCPDATPFQSPACLLPWARHHAPDRLAAVTAWEGEHLVGLAPVFSWQGRLLLAGTGPTDYDDALVEPGRADVAAALLAAVCGLALERSCPSVELHQLRAGSLLLSAPPPPGWADRFAAGDPCPVAPVSGRDGLGAMPAKWRKKLDYTRRKAERAGGWRIDDVTSATVDAAMGALTQLHARRWEAAGETGVLGDPLMAAFLAEAAPALLAEGLLRLRTLTIEGEVAAALLALHAHEVTCMYLVGYDPARTALGPGTLLIAHTLERAAGEGAREIDFLRGEEPYKANWGAVARPTFRRVLHAG